MYLLGWYYRGGLGARVHLVQSLFLCAHRARCASLGGCSTPKANGLWPPSGRGGRTHGALTACATACFSGAASQPLAMPLRKGLHEKVAASLRGEGRASIGWKALNIGGSGKGDEGGGEPVRAEAASCLLWLRSRVCGGGPSPWHCLRSG